MSTRVFLLRSWFVHFSLCHHIRLLFVLNRSIFYGAMSSSMQIFRWLHFSLLYGCFRFAGAQQPTAGVAKPVPATTVQTAASESSGIVKKAVPSKVFDINAKQVCKRKGCGNTFTEKDNHQEACNYHPGPAVFHDRLRGV